MRTLVLALLAVATPASAQGVSAAYQGVWAGYYTATQGVTRVVVSVVPDGDSTFVGDFLFYADNSNPDVPAGHYTIEGLVDTSKRTAAFYGDEWVERPDNYVFVGFMGVFDPQTELWEGDVFMEGLPHIGAFSLARLY